MGAYVQDNDRKELFSLAYARAVCASAGFTADKPLLDRDSCDLNIRSVGPGGLPGSPQIDLQVKSTATFEAAASVIAYDLPIKNYNDLRDAQPMVPRALVVVLLQPDFDNWVNVREEELKTEFGAVGYWHVLIGAERRDTRSVRVHIPRGQVFDASGAAFLMQLGSTYLVDLLLRRR